MRPAFKIVNASGKDLTQNYTARLIEMTVTDESTEQSDSLSVRLDNADGKLVVPQKGHVLSVAIGYDGQLREMGKFTCDTPEVEGAPDTVSINAKAAPFATADGFKPMQTRNSRSWDNVKLGELVETVASKAGLVTSIGPELASVVIPHIDQTSESDINFLTRLARQFGAVAKPTFGNLAFVKRGQAKSATGKAVGGITIRRSDVSHYSSKLGSRTSAGKVKTKYHDNLSAETKEIISDSGIDSLSDLVHEDHILYPTKEAAEFAANSQLDAMNRGAQTVDLQMAGNADILAEGTVNLVGFPEPLNGSWLVKSVAHTISKQSGFKTSVKLESSAERSGKQSTSTNTDALIASALKE